MAPRHASGDGRLLTKHASNTAVHAQDTPRAQTHLMLRAQPAPVDAASFKRLANLGPVFRAHHSARQAGPGAVQPRAHRSRKRLQRLILRPDCCVTHSARTRVSAVRLSAAAGRRTLQELRGDANQASGGWPRGPGTERRCLPRAVQQQEGSQCELQKVCPKQRRASVL